MADKPKKTRHINKIGARPINKIEIKTINNGTNKRNTKMKIGQVMKAIIKQMNMSEKLIHPLLSPENK